MNICSPPPNCMYINNTNLVKGNGIFLFYDLMFFYRFLGSFF